MTNSAKKSQGKKNSKQQVQFEYIPIDEHVQARKNLLLIAKESIQAEKIYQGFLKKQSEENVLKQEMKSLLKELKDGLNEILEIIPEPSVKKEIFVSSSYNNTQSKKSAKKINKPLDDLESQIKELEERIASL